MARNLKKLKDNIVTITDDSQNEFKKVLRQYRIILSADTASEVRQMPSQKRR